MRKFLLLTFCPGSLVGQINTEKTPGEPMPAQEAADSMILPEGFKATVFASEPDVQNPIDFSWDSKGRLWIAENYTYERRRDVKLPEDLCDRIVIFHDEDNDGVHDTRKVFADDLKNLTSVEWAPNGVYVMCPPRLMFIADENQDDVPDGPPVTLLDGFTEPGQNNHNFANGLRWGPDGWLYGRCGASAPGDIGKPGTLVKDRIPLRGGIWRYHVFNRVYETLCHGTTNPWGHDWNADGDLFFINTVNGHFWHMIPGAHYVRSHTVDPNPYVYQLIDHHADHWHFDTSGSWTASRNGAANHLGGGHAHVGLCIYQGQNFPEKYHGKAFTLNLHGQRANVERLERKGSGYVAKHEPDFFISKDPFFRGIDLTVGPDGSMFVLDWSDNGECHETTGVHRTSGRIYRIKYEKNATSVKPDLARIFETALDEFSVIAVGEKELISSGWYDEMLNVLGHHRDGIQVPNDAKPPHVFLSLIDSIFSTRIFPNDIESGVVPFPEFLPKASDVSSEMPSAQVRLLLASGLQRLEVDDRLRRAMNLLNFAEDADDHNLPLMIWYGLIPVAESDPMGLARLVQKSKIPLVSRFITRRLMEDLHESPIPLNHILESCTGKPNEFKAAILRGLVDASKAWHKAPEPAAWSAFAASLSQCENIEIKQQLSDLKILFGDGKALDEVKALALNSKADLSLRKSALKTLTRAQHPELKSIALKLLGTRFLNLEAARALVRFDDAKVAKKVLENYRKLHPSTRSDLLHALTSQPTFSFALLDEIAAGKIKKSELSPVHARQILAHQNPELTDKLTDTWGFLRNTPADKKKLIDSLKKSLTSEVLAKADHAKGAAIFSTHCASCHKLKGKGGAIGPDLTGAGRSNLDYLLENIIDPSAEVSSDFLLSSITMTDGRILVGTILRQNDTTLTLQTPTEKIDLPRDQIKARKITTQSLMPEGLLQSLKPDQQRDLLKFLMTP